MKKILFCLIATVLFTNIIFSQSPENIKNNYDYIGKLHNELILEFIKQNTKPSMSINEVLFNLKPIVLSNDSYKEKFGDQYYNLSETQIKKYMPDIVNNFSTLINDQNISSESKMFLNDLMSIISKAKDYSSIYNSIIQIEDEIMVSKISNSEKEILLSATSVRRHSSYLWLMIKPETANNQNVTGRRGTFWSILADVAGGVAGWPGGPAAVLTCASAASIIVDHVANK